MAGDEGALVELRGITKRFPGGTLANDAIDLDLRWGEIRLRGRRVRFRSPRDAIRHGLGMVHQHFMLVPTFTVAENLVLSQPSPRWPLLEDRRAVAARALSTASAAMGGTFAASAGLRAMSRAPSLMP